MLFCPRRADPSATHAGLLHPWGLTSIRFQKHPWRLPLTSKVSVDNPKDNEHPQRAPTKKWENIWMGVHVMYENGDLWISVSVQKLHTDCEPNALCPSFQMLQNLIPKSLQRFRTLPRATTAFVFRMVLSVPFRTQLSNASKRFLLVPRVCVCGVPYRTHSLTGVLWDTSSFFFNAESHNQHCLIIGGYSFAAVRVHFDSSSPNASKCCFQTLQRIHHQNAPSYTKNPKGCFVHSQKRTQNAPKKHPKRTQNAPIATKCMRPVLPKVSNQLL